VSAPAVWPSVTAALSSSSGAALAVSSSVGVADGVAAATFFKVSGTFTVLPAAARTFTARGWYPSLPAPTDTEPGAIGSSSDEVNE
jgi:hypothetical protein